MLFHTEDSIVAIATPPGRGAISTIRLSGPKVFEMASKQIQTGEGITPAARTAHLGQFLDLQRRLLDKVLFTFFPGPNSYTGEDLVEISCHGSPVIAKNIVKTLLDMGLRLAEPGEFTLRAVLHGKMDLLQAEAVQDLVESKTGFQAQHAANQLAGQLSDTLNSVRRALVDVVCQMETAIEFVEEGLNTASQQELLHKLDGIDQELKGLEGSFRKGRLIRDGIRAVLTGKPNAGKSSIFNSLTGTPEAIVTAEPGTTRDALKEVVVVEGIPVTLIDTAGIREEQEDSLEHLGVERSLHYLGESDLALFVIDRSVAYDDNDRRIWDEIGGRPYLLLINKTDLPAQVEVPEEVVVGCRAKVELSALQNSNLDEVRAAISDFANTGRGGESERPTMTRLRHKRCIERARRELEMGMSAYSDDLGEEVALVNLKNSLRVLGELMGEVTTGEILDQVFASFCIGK